MFRNIGINADGDRIDGHLATLEQLLAQFQSAGYDAVEVSVTGLGCIRAGELAPAEVARTRALLSRFGLRLSLHAPNELSLIRSPMHLKVMDAVLTLADQLGAEGIVYHSAQIALHDPARHLAPLPDEAELQAMWDRETEQLIACGRRAAGLGLSLAVENRDPHLWEVAALARHGRPAAELSHYHQGLRLDLLAQQVQAVGLANVGLCLDVGHAYLAAPYWPEADYLAGLRHCAAWVHHVHLHDNMGRIDDIAPSLGERLVFGEADTHLPPGWGRIPLDETLAVLHRAGYDRDLVVEIRPRYLEALPEALANTRRLCAALPEV